MTDGARNTSLDEWLKNFQAEVSAFASVSGLKLGGIASRLGYSASSAVTKNLDPNSRPTESFISRMAASFDGFSNCWVDYVRIRDGVGPKPSDDEHELATAPWSIRIQKKRSEISQKQKELMALFHELESLIVDFGEDSQAG